MIVLGVFVLAAAAAVMLDDKIENWFATSIVGLTMMVYLLARIGLQDFGIILAVILCAVSACYLGYKCFNERNKICSSVMTFGGLAFLFFSFFFFVYCIGHDATGSPDSTYWIKIVKGIYYDKSYWELLNKTTHPQAIAVWGYLAMRTWVNWSDTVLIATNDIMLISYLMPLFSFLKEDDDKAEIGHKRYYMKAALLALCILLLPCLSDGMEYSIYASDMIMALALGMGVVLFERGVALEDNRYYINALVFFMSAIVTKRIAIALASILFIWIFYVLIEKKKYRLILSYVVAVGLEYICINGFSKNLVCLLGAFIVAFAAYHCIAKKSKMIIVLSAIALGLAVCGGVAGIALYKNADRVDHILVASSFGKMLFTAKDGWYYVGDIIRLPLIVFFVINVIAFLFYSKKELFSISAKQAFAGLMTFTITYLFLMFYLYMTQISSASGASMQENLLGLSRYMKIIPIIFSCYWLSIIVSKASIKTLSLVIVVLMLFVRLEDLSKFMLTNDERITYEDIDAAGVELTDNTQIAFIDMGMVNHYRSFYLNMFYRTNVVNVDELSYTYRWADDMNYIDETQLKDIVAGCKYLYIFNADEEFANLYGGLFSNSQSLNTDRAIYQFNVSSGKYELLSVD